MIRDRDEVHASRFGRFIHLLGRRVAVARTKKGNDVVVARVARVDVHVGAKHRHRSGFRMRTWSVYEPTLWKRSARKLLPKSALSIVLFGARKWTAAPIPVIGSHGSRRSCPHACSANRSTR